MVGRGFVVVVGASLVVVVGAIVVVVGAIVVVVGAVVVVVVVVAAGTVGTGVVGAVVAGTGAVVAGAVGAGTSPPPGPGPVGAVVSTVPGSSGVGTVGSAIGAGSTEVAGVERLRVVVGTGAVVVGPVTSTGLPSDLVVLVDVDTVRVVLVRSEDGAGELGDDVNGRDDVSVALGSLPVASGPRAGTVVPVSVAGSSETTATTAVRPGTSGSGSKTTMLATTRRAMTAASAEPTRLRR